MFSICVTWYVIPNPEISLIPRDLNDSGDLNKNVTLTYKLLENNMDFISKFHYIVNTTYMSYHYTRIFFCEDEG